MNDRTRGVVVAHGDLAGALIRAVERIAGPADSLVAVSNEGLPPQEVRRLVEAAAGGGPAIIFTDLASGSCALAGFAVATRGRCAVLTGVNLPMLLDFVFHADMELDELAERLVRKARGGIDARMPPAGSRADHPVSH